MTFFLNDALPPDVAARGVDTPIPSFWGGVSASFRKEQIETNASFRVQNMMQEERRGLSQQVVDASQGEVVRSYYGERGLELGDDLETAQRNFMMTPDAQAYALKYARDRGLTVDTSEEAIERRVNERLAKEHKDATDTLAASNGGAATLIGGMAGQIWDVRQLPFVLAGGGGGSIARVMAREAMLNVAAEGATMPSRFGMAETLNIPDPDVPTTLAMAAVGGAVLGGAMEGLARGVTYWRGTRGAPSERVAGYDVEMNVDVAEDAIADGARVFEVVPERIREDPKNLVLEDFAEQQPLSGLRPTRGAGERVPVGFDEWVTPPAAGNDVRLPRSETSVPSAPPPPRADVGDLLKRLEAHRIDDFARGLDPQAFGARDALLQAARRQREQADQAVPRYEADRQAARDGAVRAIDQLEEELRGTRGKQARSELRSRIQAARADLVEIESLRGETGSVAAGSQQAIVDAEQALMARMGELAPRISTARAQAASQIGDAPRLPRSEEAPPLERADYDTAVAEYEAARRQAVSYGRELDDALFKMPEAPAWVDDVKAREAVIGHATAELRSQAEASGPFGPILRQFQGRPEDAIEELKRLQAGDAIGALQHPHIGPVDLVWGEAGSGKSGHGLAKIIRKHPEVMDDLQGRLSSSTTITSEGPNRVRLTNGRDIFVIRKDFEGSPKRWLLTAYEQGFDEGGDVQRSIGRRTGRAGELPEGSSPSAPLPSKDSASAPFVQEDRLLPEEIEMRRASEENPSAMVDMGDGKGERPLSSVLDELDADDDFADVIALCRRRM